MRRGEKPAENGAKKNVVVFKLCALKLQFWAKKEGFAGFEIQQQAGLYAL
jgi:hypothetical protein